MMHAFRFRERSAGCSEMGPKSALLIDNLGDLAINITQRTFLYHVTSIFHFCNAY